MRFSSSPNATTCTLTSRRQLGLLRSSMQETNVNLPHAKLRYKVPQIYFKMMLGCYLGFYCTHRTYDSYDPRCGIIQETYRIDERGCISSVTPPSTNGDGQDSSQTARTVTSCSMTRNSPRHKSPARGRCQLCQGMSGWSCHAARCPCEASVPARSLR